MRERNCDGSNPKKRIAFQFAQIFDIHKIVESSPFLTVKGLVFYFENRKVLAEAAFIWQHADRPEDLPHITDKTLKDIVKLFRHPAIPTHVKKAVSRKLGVEI